MLMNLIEQLHSKYFIFVYVLSAAFVLLADIPKLKKKEHSKALILQTGLVLFLMLIILSFIIPLFIPQG